MAERALATAYVTIVPSFKGFESEFDKGIGSKTEDIGKRAGGKFSTGFKSIIGPALATFSVAAIGSFLSSAISSASDLAEQGGAVGQVFGAAAAEVTKFAEGGARTLGQSTVQILDAAKSFGIYGKAAGLAGVANAKFSTDFVGLATDLASFNNTTVDEALLALQSGLRGEAEPLRKYGVLLDDATLRQEAMRLGLVKTLDQALTPAQKVLAAQAAIYKQTATQQGDFTRTSGGLANQQRIMAAEITNAKTAIGQSLLPVMKTIVTYIADKVVPAFQRFIDQFKAHKTWLNPAVDAIKGFVTFMITYKDFLLPIVGGIVAVVAAFKTYQVIMGFVTMVTTLATAAQAAFNFVLTANPIGIIVVAIGALIAGLVLFFTKTAIGRAIFASFIESVKLGFALVKGLAIDFANAFIDGINLIIHGINLLIRSYNLIPGHTDIKTIGTIGNIEGGLTSTNNPLSTPTVTPAATTAAKQAQHRGTGNTLIYNAAPNQSLDSHAELKKSIAILSPKGFK